MAEVAGNLNITQEENEPDSQWHRRIAHSLIGGQMLSALYDFDDTAHPSNDNLDTSVSMQYILKRGESLISALDIDEFEADNLRNLYMRTGYMMHKSNRLTYPLRSYANSGDITFVRGFSPFERVYLSGIGGYIIKSESSAMSVEKMFGIEELDSLSWLSNVEKSIIWRDTDQLPQDVEFLNLCNDAKRGYWQSTPPLNGITLCRTTGIGETEYTLLRISNTIQKSVMPTWRIENGEYYRIAIALRIANGNAPSANIEFKKYTAEIVTDFLLPSAEQNFFELYSWPTIGNSRWRRTISLKLYPTLIRILERLGYKLSEVR
jgi:hypothetical protein